MSYHRVKDGINECEACYPEPRFTERMLIGVPSAAWMASWAVRRSMWFSLEPLPDDYWRFRFKEENGDSVDEEIARPGTR